MSTEDNKALCRHAFEEVWINRNLASIDETMGADNVVHVPLGTFHGLEGNRQYATMYLSAFPDSQWTIEDMFAEGDKVVVRWSGRGTHLGPLPGIPATGKPATFTGILITRLEGGKMVETWGEFSSLEMMQQLGVMPAPGPAS